MHTMYIYRQISYILIILHICKSGLLPSLLPQFYSVQKLPLAGSSFWSCQHKSVEVVDMMVYWPPICWTSPLRWWRWRTASMQAVSTWSADVGWRRWRFLVVHEYLQIPLNLQRSCGTGDKTRKNSSFWYSFVWICINRIVHVLGMSFSFF